MEAAAVRRIKGLGSYELNSNLRRKKKKKKKMVSQFINFRREQDFRTNLVGNVTASIESGSKRNFIYCFPFTFPNVNLKFK